MKNIYGGTITNVSMRARCYKRKVNKRGRFGIYRSFMKAWGPNLFVNSDFISDDAWLLL